MLVKFHIKYLIGWLLLGSICSSCQNKHGKRNIVVGVSYQNLQNEFIINIQDAIRKRAKEDSIDLIELDAQGKSENQISQIENFIAADVDAIILNPCDKEGSAPAVDIAVRDKKPIIVINSAVTNLNKANALG